MHAYLLYLTCVSFFSIAEPLGVKVWTLLVKRIHILLEKGEKVKMQLFNPLVRHYHSIVFFKLTTINFQFSMKGFSSDYGETLLPLLAVMQDFVDNSLLAPSLVLVSFQYCKFYE